VHSSCLTGDVAGVIDDIGADVSEFRVGDEIYGCAGGFTDEGSALSEFMLADVRINIT
jgi:NADPH2:quinone reductase